MSQHCARCDAPSTDLQRVDVDEEYPPPVPIRWCPKCRAEGLVPVKRGRATVGVHHLPQRGARRPRGT